MLSTTFLGSWTNRCGLRMSRHNNNCDTNWCVFFYFLNVANHLNIQYFVFFAKCDHQYSRKLPTIDIWDDNKYTGQVQSKRTMFQKTIELLHVWKRRQSTIDPIILQMPISIQITCQIELSEEREMSCPNIYRCCWSLDLLICIVNQTK